MACEIMSKGGLVGDDIVNGIVASRISRPDCADGFLLDGYPRTVAQAQSLDALLRQRSLPEPVVVHLDVSEELLVARLTARRQCSKCLRIYNLLSQPPAAEGICDDDGAGLVTRDDDQESVIRDRLRAYENLTGPILAWYGSDRVHTVDGSSAPAQVALAIEQVVVAAVAHPKVLTVR
jgi:adenylate kinase